VAFSVFEQNNNFILLKYRKISKTIYIASKICKFGVVFVAGKFEKAISET